MATLPPNEAGARRLSVRTSASGSGKLLPLNHRLRGRSLPDPDADVLTESLRAPASFGGNVAMGFVGVHDEQVAHLGGGNGRAPDALKIGIIGLGGPLTAAFRDRVLCGTTRRQQEGGGNEECRKGFHVLKMFSGRWSAQGN